MLNLPLSKFCRVLITAVGHLLLSCLVVGCTPWLEPTPQPEAPIQAQQIALNQSNQCSGQFVTHDLPHITAAAVERVAYFISNGSGLAVNDLDNDGDLDIVLGNLLGPNQIFWNEGSWQFRPETLFEGSARAVTTVDVDGDGWLDIVVTGRVGNISHWRNTGTLNEGSVRQFVPEKLLGVDALAYSLNWGDLDTDGDLDLVAASYDASLEKQMGEIFKLSRQSGVFVYENQRDEFDVTRLAETAQALALDLLDLNQDGRLDILVGNDFDVPDQAWVASEMGWTFTAPFSETTHSTMSFATGDLDNDGKWDLFAADMHPYSDAPTMMAQWQPVLDTMEHNLPPGDPQRMENVLQQRDETGTFLNNAAQYGIIASGWSWSTKFGDLDQDGWLDLYVVNGMRAMEIFRHLPNDELVEENQMYRNDGQGQLIPAPDWGLNSRYGGRSMSMADLDNDGDLDIIINNLRQPAQLFENQLCQGSNLQVDLRWPASNNTHAIGATITLRTSTGIYTRQVRATSGYLSGDPSRIHFGFPTDSQLQQLVIQWPDQVSSSVTNLKAGDRLIIERE